MSLVLILTRHAKSSWDDPLQDDHDRVLNKRGRRAAPRVGAWLADKGYIPAEVISSTARRTLETWEHIATHMPDGTLMRREPLLYHASAPRMLDVLRGAVGETVMMLGHNPGIGSLASRLPAKRPDHSRFSSYPTGATLVVRFDAPDWDKVTYDSGTVLDFVTPRDLGEA